MLEESDTFYHRVEEYHITLFHTQPPQNQCFSHPRLNKGPIASSLSSRWLTKSTRFTRFIRKAHLTKPVKAPAYTHALPYIGNEECIKMVI